MSVSGLERKPVDWSTWHFGKSVSNDVFLTFFFFFYSTDIIYKTNPICRWHVYQFPTSAHKRPADSYVPRCLAWLILTTATSPAWGLTDRVKWCHRPFVLKIRRLWLSTGLCCSLCRLFFFLWFLFRWPSYVTVSCLDARWWYHSLRGSKKGW